MKKEVLLEQEHKKDDVREKNQLDANKLSKKRVSNPLRVTTKLRGIIRLQMSMLEVSSNSFYGSNMEQN